MMNRRSFFATLAAPLLAPLAKLLPKPAAPVLIKSDVLSVTLTGAAEFKSKWIGFDPGVSKSVVYFWGRDGVYILDGEYKTMMSGHQPYRYWHGQTPFVKLDLSKVWVDAGSKVEILEQ